MKSIVEGAVHIVVLFIKAREAIKIKGVVIGELWGDRNAPSPMINRIFSICIPRVKQICKSKSTFAAQSQPMI